MSTLPSPDRKRSGMAAAWTPAVVLAVGAVLLLGVGAQRAMVLNAPLEEALPEAVRGMPGLDLEVPDDEAEVAGFTDYAMRLYQEASPDGTPADSSRWASVYLGFYDTQTQGRTIHSPKNCLPGSGWEALSSRPQPLAVGSDTVTVNRYVLQNGDARALVLYWYQGRGRVAYSEYWVKWDLLRDAALKRRTDEALARVVVPINTTEEEAFELAREIAVGLMPGLDRSLPD